MSNIEVFENKEFGKVRTLEIDNEPWFVGKDVLIILGYSDLTHGILDHVDDDDRVNSKTQGLNDPELGQRGSWLINESGLYTLILSSKIPTAKKFKRWVTSEVLPSIRKYGSYSADIPKTLPECLIAYANEIKAHEETKKMLEIAQPKADFYDTVVSTESLLSMGDTAKLINKKGVGRNNLYKILKARKILMADNIPYQQYIERGYFKVVESYYMAGDNKVITKTTYVKQKGVDYIRKLLSSEVSA